MLCFAGNMLGANPGFITTQGQIVADLFAAEGARVVRVSSRINRVMRLGEIVGTLVARRRAIDVVVLEVYSGLNMIMTEAVGALCKRLGLPLVMVLHGGALPEFIERSPRRTRIALARADRLVAPSPFLAERIGAYGFEIDVIPNVLDIESYDFRERADIRPRLIWMRSFHRIYNPQLAVRVLARLRPRHPEATLVMGGVDKGLEAETKRLAHELGVADAIEFPGFLDENAKRKAFDEADIFINTNRRDNMPVSVLEACASGLPVVVTKVGGLPYLITHGENGLLTCDDSDQSMAAAVDSLIGNPKLVRTLSRGGRQLAEKSAWRSVKKQWENLFKEVVR